MQEIQGGGERAGYGKKVIDGLSSRLAVRYGRGFSTTNLRYFRTFYQMFAERVPTIVEQLDEPNPIFHESSGKLGIPAIRHKPCGEFKTGRFQKWLAIELTKQGAFMSVPRLAEMANELGYLTDYGSQFKGARGSYRLVSGVYRRNIESQLLSEITD